ncbi:MAG: nucleotidyl transferase AbiEii/AbiGii toxin family protein [Anaerolineae bacterium]|nr:nucleotidyl transferase AbiEii/AbiGii toxin family protein [Anaerolineae bacterium]
MDTLIPHWEAVTTQTRELWGAVTRLPHIQHFYLAGGTALALRMGHRISQDLDLFAYIETLDDDMRYQILDALRREHTVDLLQDSVLGLVLTVDDLPISFFSYNYPLLDPAVEVEGLRIAGLTDIGLMKLDAVAGRGTRKDFYDLYFIATQVSLNRLFARSEEKYAHARGFGMRVLTALVDFDIAEQQADPTLLQPVTWEMVKSFCIAESRRLGETWFNTSS